MGYRKIFYLFLFFWLCYPTCGILVQCGSKLGPWQWELGVLTSEPPGNSQEHFLQYQKTPPFPFSLALSTTLDFRWYPCLLFMPLPQRSSSAHLIPIEVAKMCRIGTPHSLQVLSKAHLLSWAHFCQHTQDYRSSTASSIFSFFSLNSKHRKY